MVNPQLRTLVPAVAPAPSLEDDFQFGCIATAMIYASLPHSDLGEKNEFKRRHNNLSITLLVDSEIGLPCGKIPRLITAFLCTEAKRGSREIFLGRSLNEFVEKLGMTASGGEFGTKTAVLKQAKRLFASHFTLIGEGDNSYNWRNVVLAESGHLHWSAHCSAAKALWESQLMLSETFFKECVQHGVPIDLRVLQKLRSPLAIDIYVWMTYRYHAIKRPTPISWKQLKWQFGSNYSDDEQGLENFKFGFKGALRKAHEFYPGIHCLFDERKLVLMPARPSVLPRREG
ncbi:replication protein RepA [Xanthomonas translucens]|nr:replication protein RepA [Xanthomonas translucens]